MYIHFDPSVRRIQVLHTEQGFTAFTRPIDYDYSLLQHCLYFPTALYYFVKSYFRRHRIAPEEGSVHNLVCNIPTRGDFLIILELSPDRISKFVEING